MPYPFYGMRTTEDWNDPIKGTDTDRRPTNIRQMILFKGPNGDRGDRSANLLALLSKIADEKTTDPIFKWFEELMSFQDSPMTAGNVFTNAAMTTPYTSGGVQDAIVYVKVPELFAKEIVPGHHVTFSRKADADYSLAARVTDRVVNGSDSRLTCRLWEADDNSATSDLSDADHILITGVACGEGTKSVDGVAYNPKAVENYTEITKTSIGPISKGAEQQQLNTGKPWIQMVEDSMMYHGNEIERKLWFNPAKRKTTDENGNVIYTTTGINDFIQTHRYSFNKADPLGEYDYASSNTSWSVGGLEFLNKVLPRVFKYGRNRKLAYCGVGALQAFQMLAYDNANLNITMETGMFGIAVRVFQTTFGIIDLIIHPLFSWLQGGRFSNSVFIIDPREMRYMYRTDSDGKRDFRVEKNIQDNDSDSRKDQFLTECGLELHHEEQFGVLNVGIDN